MQTHEAQTFSRILEIMKARKSRLMVKLHPDSQLSALSRELREAIVEELSAEFSENGLGPDDEPTKYGEELEQLIDSCRLHFDDPK